MAKTNSKRLVTYSHCRAAAAKETRLENCKVEYRNPGLMIQLSKPLATQTKIFKITFSHRAKTSTLEENIFKSQGNAILKMNKN